MDELRAGLDDALSGSGRLLLLMGEPGIGKTRMAEELATYARLRGAQVLLGRCYEGEGAPAVLAVGPGDPLVRPRPRRRRELVSVMGTGAADIAQVVSEVRERIPGLPSRRRSTPEQARFRLFDSITTFLQQRLARRSRSWSCSTTCTGPTSRRCCCCSSSRARCAARRLLVLGTYRDVELRRQHPLAQTLADLARENSASASCSAG